MEKQSMNLTAIRLCRAAILAGALCLTASSHANIVSNYVGTLSTVNLTTFDPNGSGSTKLDWAYWGRGGGVTDESTINTAVNSMFNGSGITKTFFDNSTSTAFVNAYENTAFTGVGWSWSDGISLASGTHANGITDGAGMRIAANSGQYLDFTFAGSAASLERAATLHFRSDVASGGTWNILALQGASTTTLYTGLLGNSTRLLEVFYDGTDPLTIRLQTAGTYTTNSSSMAIRGIAATLSEVPEPSTLALVLCGLAGVVALRRGPK